jgi:hypothetical protein
MATEITTQITAQIDTLAAIYAEAYRNAFARVAAWKTENPGRSPRNDYYMASVARMADQVTSYVGGIRDTAHLDESIVAKVATRQATALAANYAAKVEGKAAGMTGVAVSRMDATGSFIVTGTKAGRAVEIRQSVVTKVSPKGTWFCQFPALVYIDRTKSTEKALKAL